MQFTRPFSFYTEVGLACETKYNATRTFYICTITLHTLLHVPLFNLLLILILPTSISTTDNNVAFSSTCRTTTTVATTILLFSSVHRTTSNIMETISWLKLCSWYMQLAIVSPPYFLPQLQETCLYFGRGMESLLSAEGFKYLLAPTYYGSLEDQHSIWRNHICRSQVTVETSTRRQCLLNIICSRLLLQDFTELFQGQFSRAQTLSQNREGSGDETLAGYCDNCILLYREILQWH